jgi:hypothetical protein
MFTSTALPGSGYAAPTVGQFAEIQLTAQNLNYAQNATVCPGMLDCFRYDDSRLSYLDGSTKPTVVVYPTAVPSAVIDLASSNLGCLVGVDVRKSAALTCVDVTGAFAPLVQTAHAPVVPAPPPTLTAAASPSGAPSGWEHSPVTVTLTASDGTGPGVKSITYSATGAQPIAETAVPGSSAQFSVTADGTTTVVAWATDNAGTPSIKQSLKVSVDQTPPAIACATPGTAWSAGDISIACTASDPTSGLANPAQATFSLSTSVPAGTETAAAATNSVTVCDLAGNCATAGPITGLKVDRLAPTISMTSPAGSYTVGQVVNAVYTCTDGGSGLATCTGTVPSGSPLNTAAAGTYTFTVDATDTAGNHSVLVANYTVTTPPTPAPKRLCNEKESGTAEMHENDCEVHAAAVRPVKAPDPTPTPKPQATHKPAQHGTEVKDDQKGD